MVHNGNCPNLRLEYLGRTPGKGSATGKKVIDRMMDEGKIRITSDGERLEVFHPTEGWVPIEQTDMGHTKDAVAWWNSTGRFYGSKSPEVRTWMLDPDNYELEPFWINRSNGAQLKDRYLPPSPKKKP